MTRHENDGQDYLTNENGQTIEDDFTLGSIELYRFHQQAFDEDVEKRMHVFARVFTRDLLPVYYRLRETLS